MTLCALILSAYIPGLVFSASASDALPFESEVHVNGSPHLLSGSPLHLPSVSRFAVEKQANWKVEDVFSGKYDDAFFPHEGEYGNFGFSENVHWMAFEIDFDKSNIEDQLLLVMNAPTLDEVSLFIQNEKGEITRKETGYRKPGNSKDVSHHNYIFRVEAEQGNKFLLRVDTNTSSVIPLELWQEQDFQQQNYFDVIMIGIYLGVLVAMFFYNAFIFFSTREIAYLYYIVFIFFYGLLQATIDGLVSLVFWEKSVGLRGIDMMVIPAMAAITAVLFSMNFLQTKTVLPSLHRVMSATVALLVLSSLISLLTDGKGIQFTAILSLWVTCLLFVVGIFAMRAGQAGARYFMFAWMFLIIGTATYLLHIMGYFSNMLVLVYSMKTGSSIEIVLLSLGLADRFNRERKFKEMLELEKVEMESRSQTLATVDTRTGMPNRGQLQQQVAHYARRLQNFTLVLMKVRGFKQINNTLGHENGDELLKLLGLKIDSVISEGEYRYLSVGNNLESMPSKVAVVDSLTFAVILEDYHGQRLEEVALEIKESVSGTIEFKEVVLDIEMLLGISRCNSGDLKSAQRIVHEAQVGLAAAAKFDQQIGLYSPLIDPYSEEKLSLMGKLRTAVKNENLELFFQPQYQTSGLNLVGFEALLRWRDDEGEFISPAEFIPLAESCGVIRPLTRWVIQQSLEFLVQVKKVQDNLQVSINLSVSNLREDDLITFIAEQIRHLKLDPKSIKFEITESSMIENEDVALNRLLQLRRIGCQISVDDYGSGYASLGYLKQLPISEVKIDRTFIQDLEGNSDDQVIVRSTIAMCHDLGLKVVAEGVENHEVLDLLTQFECDVAQGYLLGRPNAFQIEEPRGWIASFKKG